ncbi:MAG: 6-carboxytetrahydropterin synthase [Bacteroidia bacterium]|nr:6-carboxytetrahydropterin synthase [Bacteroidia bacterium]
MIYLTRRERFNAAHRLYRKEWSDDKNSEVFGKCSNPNWHGHNYVLLVTVKGEPDPETGFLVNIKILSSLVNRCVIDKLDHKNINIEVDFMKDKIATTENLTISIWEILEPEVLKLGCQLHSIRIEETENNFAEYFGNRH